MKFKSLIFTIAMLCSTSLFAAFFVTGPDNNLMRVTAPTPKALTATADVQPIIVLKIKAKLFRSDNGNLAAEDVKVKAATATGVKVNDEYRLAEKDLASGQYLYALLPDPEHKGSTVVFVTDLSKLSDLKGKANLMGDASSLRFENASADAVFNRVGAFGNK